METIFDYNLSEEEQKYIAVFDKETYLKFDDDTKNKDLAMLFYCRGDMKKMKHYIKLVKNNYMRNSFFRTIYHP